MILFFHCLKKSDHFELMIRFYDEIVILNFVEMGLLAYKVGQIFKIKSFLGYFFINIFQDVKKVDENLHYFGFCAIIMSKVLWL